MIILGSQSPRRREILSYFTLPFRQVTPPFDEESVPFDGDPERYAKAISSGKAESLQMHFSKEIVVTADTIVYRDGRVYGKPKDEADAVQALSELVGGWHSVYTGVTLRCGDIVHSEVEETRVLFHALTEQNIRDYLKKIHFMDKAGSYAIQESGGIIVKSIEGSYYNVMGLPTTTLQKLLALFGIDLWKHLKEV